MARFFPPVVSRWTWSYVLASATRSLLTILFSRCGWMLGFERLWLAPPVTGRWMDVDSCIWPAQGVAALGFVSRCSRLSGFEQ